MWFLLVVLPIMFFGGALAFDVSQILTTHQHMTQAADAAAVGGAHEIEVHGATLNEPRAVAVGTATAAESLAALGYSDQVQVEVSTDPHTVTVEFSYRNDNLVFLRYFGHHYVEGTVARSASICVPGQPGPTEGFCARPQS